MKSNDNKKMNSDKEGNWRIQELSGSSIITESQYLSNKVKSTRYTLLSLVPMNLFEQFQRSANIWFLIVSIFQLIPFGLNPVDSWTTVVPLAILITLTLLKDAYNDYYRGKEDKKLNSSDYIHWTGGEFTKVKCEDLLVGNIVQIKEGQKFPADVIVLGTKGDRKFFLDTAGINGCSDLMSKRAVGETQNLIKNLDIHHVLSRLAGMVSFEGPNNDFSSFKGKLKLSGHPKAITLMQHCLAYRGSSLRGTEWVIGIVVYTGLETKTYLNIGKPRRKVSKLEKTINKWVLSLLIILLLLVIFSFLALRYLSVSQFANNDYLQSFVLFTILYNNIIPISLFVTMDMLRIFQSFFISRRSKRNFDFNTGDVNENLGQVEYLFTDKSGILTEDDLRLKLCVIGNSRYFREEDEQDKGQTVLDEEKPLFTRVLSESSTKILPKVDSSRTGFFSERLANPFNKLKQTLFKDENSNLYQYVRCLAVCNSVVRDDSNFIGISRDEIAMVEAAQEMGIRLMSRSASSIEIDSLNSTEKYDVLATSPYSSSIKRSSVLIKTPSDYLLYTKGSYEEIVRSIEENGSEDLEAQYHYINKQGYRIIAFSYKRLSESAANEFVSKVENARNIPVDSEGRIQSLFQDLQKDSISLGLAGIEDVVLPETIHTIEILQKAGIKIWVLTGDNDMNTSTTARKVGLIKNDSQIISLSKIQTESKCISYMMRLISQHFFNEFQEDPISRNASQKKFKAKGSYTNKLDSEESLHLNDNKNEKARPIEPKASENNAEMMLAQHPLYKQKVKPEIAITDFLSKMFFPNSVNYTLSIDRQSFITALASDEARKLLCCLMFGASSVLFYDLLPMDKAKIVNLVKDNFSFRPVTMAIGQGYGDIPMIQAADVGIAKMGRHESQAKSYADIAITHFSHLKELLLLHGHWNYSRMSRAVLLFIYKNCLLTVITFAYMFVSDFSGESVFKSSLIVGFNIGFTSLPILALGVFDEDMRVSKIYEYPELYSQGQMQTLFNWRRVAYYLLLSVIDGILIPLLLGKNNFSVLNSEGYAEDSNITGTTLYIMLVLTVLIQIALDTYSFSFLYICSQGLSLLILAGYLWFISSVSFANSDLLGTGQEIAQSPKSFLLIFIVPLILLAIHQAYAQYSAVFKPGIYEKIASSKDEQVLLFKLNRLESFAGNLSKLYRETSFTKSTLEEDAFELKKKTLHFYSEFIEAQYKDFYIYEYIKFYKWVIVLLFVLLVFWTLLEVFVFGGTLYYHIIRTLMCAGFLVIVLVIWTEFFLKYYTQITLTVIGLGLIIKFASEIAFGKPGALATGVIPAITYILFNVDFEQVSYLNLLNLSLYTISISIYYIFKVPGQDFFEQLFSVLSFLILNFAVSATSAFLGYYLERTRRLEYKLMSMEKIDVERSQRILSFLLPAFVKKRVKDGARYIAEDQGTVTILFCDIVDFDSICAEYSPQELTAFLDSVFQKFDQLCSANGVTKIETVGKTYMACSGLKDSEAELDPGLREVPHARRAVALGLAMVSLTSAIRLKSGFQLQVKIGINSGPVTAGVVGHHKPQFSLVGDTVNTSSRMCSTLESANSIQISKESYDLIENHEGLEFKANTIEAKGKGTMHTFIVNEAKSSLLDSGSKAGLSHLTTMFQNSSFNRTMTDNSKLKKKSTEMFVTLDLNEGLMYRDGEALGKVKILDFSCKENEKQLKFRLQKTENDQHLMFSGVAISLVTFSLLFGISAGEYLIVGESIFQVVLARAAIVLMLILVLAIHDKVYKRRIFTFLMLFIFLCMIAVALLDLIYNTGRANDLIALEVMYIILLLNHTSQIPLSKLIPALLLIFIPWGVLGAFTSSNKNEHAANAAFVIIFALINASAIYTIETHLRTYFSLREIAEKEKNKTDELLTQMMPPHVLENMRQDKAATDKLHEVTLLYADIVGFTAWSSNKTPIEVVGMLSDMFTRFDKKCLDHNVYKVHTIGDCYVVMGLTDNAVRNSAQECLNVVEMAQSMIKIIQEINEENGSELNMRIGIHIGQVIAGITGTNIVRYDIYGPDVLMANKMESGGMAGRINVSDAAMEVIQRYKPGKYEFELNKEIYAKVINQRRNCYFIKESQKLNNDIQR